MNYPTSYTSTVSVPLPDDDAIRSVVGDTDAKHREMIILREAKVLGTPYEWQANATMAGNAGLSTPLNAESHAGLPPAILVTNGFDPLRDVGHAYARELAAAGNHLTYVHNPNLTHGFRSSPGPQPPATRPPLSWPTSSRRKSADPTAT
jgi:acetyl esterase/lipase